MKQSIKKITLIAAAFLCTSFFSINHLPTHTPLLAIHLPVHTAENGGIHTQNYSHFFSLETLENLKCYHYGLRQLIPGYILPSAADLFDSIRSHPQFKGVVTTDQLLTHNIDIPMGKEGAQFFLYEYRLKDQPHFYLSHARGIRHFIVKDSDPIPNLVNAVTKNYPNLVSSLQSSLPLLGHLLAPFACSKFRLVHRQCSQF